MAALGLRLGGTVPFGELVVVPAAGDGPVDVVGLVEDESTAVVRVALVCGGVDVGAGRDLISRLETLPAGHADVGRLDAAYAAALDAGAPAAALGGLAAAGAGGGPRPDEADPRPHAPGGDAAGRPAGGSTGRAPHGDEREGLHHAHDRRAP